jgi:hypothetical protein
LLCHDYDGPVGDADALDILEFVHGVRVFIEFLREVLLSQFVHDFFGQGFVFDRDLCGVDFQDSVLAADLQVEVSVKVSSLESRDLVEGDAGRSPQSVVFDGKVDASAEIFQLGNRCDHAVEFVRGQRQCCSPALLYCFFQGAVFTVEFAGLLCRGIDHGDLGGLCRGQLIAQSPHLHHAQADHTRDKQCEGDHGYTAPDQTSFSA